MTKSLRRVQGITLVELLIVVAVMAVLGSIAYPLYTSQAQSARRAEAKAELQVIALAQERYYTLNGRYTNVSPLSLLMNGSSLSVSTEHGYYTLSVTTGASGDTQTYTATATATSGAAQFNDTDCRSFSINQAGTTTALDAGGSDATDACW